jgi:hypothetical protein
LIFLSEGGTAAAVNEELIALDREFEVDASNSEDESNVPTKIESNDWMQCARSVIDY